MHSQGGLHQYLLRMSVQDESSQEPVPVENTPPIVEIKTRPSRSSKKKKPRRKSRNRIRDDIDTASNDPDYSPDEELIEEGSGSTCSTPVPEKFSSHESTPIPQIYPSYGTVCGLCYYGEKSLLGQGELTKYDPTPGFNPFRRPVLKTRGSKDSFSGLSPASDLGDRTGKSPSRRSRETRNSRDSTSRSSEMRMEVVEELSNVGTAEIADATQVFESTGHVTAHHCCAAWSEGVTQNELYQLLCVDKAVHSGMTQKCSYCGRYGATIKCKATKCDRFLHYPCAAGSGCFQDIKALLLICPEHLEQAPSIASSEELNCALCDDIGEISDFLFCTSCGHHYHGSCLHVDVNPLVRVGWQCPECKICQTCRQPGDDNKMLVCDSCDKGYHTYCLQPAMSFIPKNGWCCQACRRCTDCGLKSTTPNAQWHCNDQVCDDCFQQREKGLSCPVCGKSYHTEEHKNDMLHCNECKRWIHESCEDMIDMETYCDMGSDYTCPKCRDEAEDVDEPAPDPAAVESKDASKLDLAEEISEKADDLTEPMDEDSCSKDPAKRSNVSSSIESDKCSSGMKGSSTDPMLFSAGSQKKRNGSNEILLAQAACAVGHDRKPSSDSHTGSIFPDTDSQDALSGLFSGDAFQPVVSVSPMPFDEHYESKDGVEWTKRKPRRLSSEPHSPVKPISKSAETSPQPPHSAGMGKPGTMFGKGKPFGAAKRRPSVRSSRDKGCAKGKGRSSRKPKGGLSASLAANDSSPSGMTAPVQPASIGVRRRSRNRWHRASASETALGTLTTAEVGQESADEEYGDSMHNTVVLCSADDNFTLNQDMCVVCGSFGHGAEGRLVACSQCGQCYHPYCVNLKLTKVVLRKGWRCLDCTVCEECGDADNPSQLLLCDDCDISYHTYCLKPPLQHVPKGGWKCKWCVRCTHCGSSSPGVNSDWAENYTSCGPCASLTHCPSCRRTYRDEEIIMQCSNCERWLHSSCEFLCTESDIEKVLEKGYTCILCRPKGSTPPHLDLIPHTFEGDPSSGIYLGRTRSDAESMKEYHKDGVALTSAGLQHIQQLMQKSMGMNKKKPPVQRRKSQAQKQPDKVTQAALAASPVLALPAADAVITAKVEESTMLSPDSMQRDEIKPDVVMAVDSPALVAASPDLTYADAVVTMSEDPSIPCTSELLQSDKSTSAGCLTPSVLPESDPLSLPAQIPLEQTKSPLSETPKRRRRPYRPGIGGFNVRQRGRGSFIGSRGRRGRFQKGGVTISTGGSMMGAEGFDQAQKPDDVKLRASEITEECGSSYIKHESEGGITIAHDNQVVKDETKSTAEEKADGQTSVLVSPLKLKISTVVQPHKKRKKRARLIDQFPLYIQEGFFGPEILALSRTSLKSDDVLKVSASKDSENKSVFGLLESSCIVLPERIRLRLDQQVAQKAADSKRRAERKQERVLARRVPSGDEDGLAMDKENEDLFGALPVDLPFKDDELLGILSGDLKQGHGGQDTHESILSPDALESLVDLNSVFSDVLNTNQDGGSSNVDEQGILGELSKLSEQTAASSTAMNADMMSSANVSSAVDVATTSALLDHTAAIFSSMEESHVPNNMPASCANDKQENIRGMTPEQKQGHLLQQQQQAHQRQIQIQQQHHHQQQQQLHIQAHNILMQQPNLAAQPHMRTQSLMQSQHAHSQLPPANMQMSQQQQQHPFNMNQQNQGMMPQQSKGLSMQPQQHVQFTAGLNQAMGKMVDTDISGMSTTSQNPGLIARQQSMEVAPTQPQFGYQGQRSMTPSSAGAQMFGPSSGPTPIALPRSDSVASQSSMPRSPAVAAASENSPAKASGQPQMMAVSNLPDFPSDTHLFEPAPPPWPLGTDLEGDTLSVNQRNILKWEKDEPLGELATISPVLYANMRHTYLKKEFPDWQTRAKQVAKLWRKATPDERAPFLQKARDNRSYLKATRRDLEHLNDQELLSTELPDEDPKSGGLGEADKEMSALQSGNPEAMQGKFPGAGSLSAATYGMNKPIGPNAITTTLPEHGNFVKPRPLSRDPTPIPVSPGAASMSVRLRAPFMSGTPGNNSAGPGSRSRSPWNEQQFQQTSFTGQSTSLQQQMMCGQQGSFQNQQISGMPVGLRMPKMEKCDPSMMPCPGGRFPQPQKQIAPVGTPICNSPVKPGTPTPRQGSMHDVPSNIPASPDQFIRPIPDQFIRPSNISASHDQFVRMSVNPRPGMPPQLLPQSMTSPMHAHSQPSSPHPSGRRTPGLVVPQPLTPQPFMMRDPFQDTGTDKPMPRRMSATDSFSVGMQMPVQSPVALPPGHAGEVTGMSAARMTSADIKTELAEKAVASTAQPGMIQGNVVRPPIRETLLRHASQRRHKILEQQSMPGGSWVGPAPINITRPPPPYPSQSSVAQTVSPSAFAHPRFSAAQGPNMMLTAPGVRPYRPGLPPSPTFSQGIHSPLTSTSTSLVPSFGLERYPSFRMPTSADGSTAPAAQGGYIELKHSKQPDPAIRREQIIRAGAMRITPTTANVSSAAKISSALVTAVPATQNTVTTSSTPPQLLVPKEEHVALTASSAMPSAVPVATVSVPNAVKQVIGTERAESLALPKKQTSALDCVSSTSKIAASSDPGTAATDSHTDSGKSTTIGSETDSNKEKGHSRSDANSNTEPAGTEHDAAKSTSDPPGEKSAENVQQTQAPATGSESEPDPSSSTPTAGSTTKDTSCGVANATQKADPVSSIRPDVPRESEQTAGVNVASAGLTEAVHSVSQRDPEGNSGVADTAASAGKTGKGCESAVEPPPPGETETPAITSARTVESPKSETGGLNASGDAAEEASQSCAKTAEKGKEEGGKDIRGPEAAKQVDDAASSMPTNQAEVSSGDGGEKTNVFQKDSGDKPDISKEEVVCGDQGNDASQKQSSDAVAGETVAKTDAAGEANEPADDKTATQHVESDLAQPAALGDKNIAEISNAPPSTEIVGQSETSRSEDKSGSESRAAIDEATKVTVDQTAASVCSTDTSDDTKVSDASTSATIATAGMDSPKMPVLEPFPALSSLSIPSSVTVVSSAVALADTVVSSSTADQAVFTTASLTTVPVSLPAQAQSGGVSTTSSIPAVIAKVTTASYTAQPGNKETGIMDLVVTTSAVITTQISSGTITAQVTNVSGVTPIPAMSTASPFPNQPVVGHAPPLATVPVVPQTSAVPYHGMPGTGVAGSLPQPGALKPKNLLIKEQPLLIQDLLDAEKKEQEKARREKMTQAILQQQQQPQPQQQQQQQPPPQQQPGAMFPVMEPDEQLAQDVGIDRIRQAKIKILSGINQVINSGPPSQARTEVPVPTGPFVQHAGTTSWQQAPSGQQGNEPSMMGAPSFGTDAASQQRKARYEEWLYQHQALLQMNVKELEKAAKQHRSVKQALTKKQRQSKKSGEEFTPQDSQNLINVNKQHQETQHQLDKVRKEQIRHSELVQDYNIKQSSLQYGGMTNMQQQQPGMVSVYPHMQPQTLPHQQPPPVMRQQSAPGSLSVPMAQPPPRTGSLTPGPGVGNVVPLPVTASTVMPGAQPPSSGSPSVSAGQSSHQQKALYAHLQKMPGFRQMSPTQLHQLAVQHGMIISTAGNPVNMGTVSASSQVSVNLTAQGAQIRAPGVAGPQGVVPAPAIPGALPQANVSSVNVNTGSNMTPTQASFIRHLSPAPGPASVAEMQMQQQFMQQHMPMQEEEKPKRKRKKKKKPSQDLTQSSMPLVPAQFMQQVQMSSGLLTAGTPVMSFQQAVQMPGQLVPSSGAFVSGAGPLHMARFGASMPGSSGVGLVSASGQPPVNVQASLRAPHPAAISGGYPAASTSSAGMTPRPVMPGVVPGSMHSIPATASLSTRFISPAHFQQHASNVKKDQNKPARALLAPGDMSAHRFLAPPMSHPIGLNETEMNIVRLTNPDTSPGTSEKPKENDAKATPDGAHKQMLAERSRSLIDETITSVIRDGAEYDDKLEMAKFSGETVSPPSWMRPLQPSKLAAKYSASMFASNQLLSGAGGLMGESLRLGNHQELLRHMLQQSMPAGGGARGDAFAFSKAMEGGMIPEDVKKQLELAGHPYFLAHADESGTSKKKRSRKLSKDKDAKAGSKKRRKKNKDEDGTGEDVMRSAMDLPINSRGDLSPESAIIKSVSQWKPLPLPPLVEPDIKLNYNMCVPKGTGLPLSKSLLEGTIGNATYRGLPDYYDLLLCKDPLSFMDPPTPPSSLPPSPKRERLNSIDEMKKAYEQQAVKVPDSLPTPPHHGPESMEDIANLSHITEDSVQPSSPYVDDGEVFRYGELAVMKMANAKEELVKIQMGGSMNEQLYKPLSPALPLLSYPKDDMNEEDQVSVTISLKTTSSKVVKKSLSMLSRALGTPIVGFKMIDPSKPETKPKREDSRADERKTTGDQQTSESTNAENLQPNQRRCFTCNSPVVGNGVRKPIFDEYSLEEDIIFCDKQCYFTNEFSKKPATPPVSKKKWKASHVYQRHTTKINLASLIEANPDPDHISTRGQRVHGANGSSDSRAGDVSLKTADGKGRGRARRRGSTGPGDENRVSAKRWKGIKWKRWTVTITVVKSTSQKPPPDIEALLSKYGSALKPPADAKDTRTCVLCSVSGDGETNGSARLLNLDVDQWVHLNCALWSAEVYETQGGALINVDLAVRHGSTAICGHCQKKGATISCNRPRCTNIYHCACALQCDCMFFKDKTVLCPIHAVTYTSAPGCAGSDQLRSLAVFRKVYVQRQETKQIASIMQQGELTQGEKNYILRVGALMFHAVGQLSTHQMGQFHSKSAIYPVGYKATRIYWSSNNTRKRCKYMCMITETDSKPFFTTRYQAVASRPKSAEASMQGQWVELAGENVNEQWMELLQQLVALRAQQKMLKLFPAYINGENIFGLTSPVVCRILESLPNIELCATYKFRFGRSPLLELPLAINPTGCARTEPHIKQSRKKPHTLISNLISEYYESTGIGDTSSSLYGKQFVHSKSSQYRRMKQEWRNNVYLARSRIQGLGLFAARDIEPGTMVIEYIGDIIRSEVAEKREKNYEAANRGVYMFRLDSDYIVDATVSGGPARYINHSCNPNCVAEVVNFEKEKKIMIISNRHILRGEELNYDYKFDFEDEGNKIPCLCGAINCRKWMN